MTDVERGRPEQTEVVVTLPGRRTHAGRSAKNAQRGPEGLPSLEHPGEEIALARDPVEHRVHRERRRIEALPHLVPPEWRRDGRAGPRTDRIDRRGRLARAVLVRVDEDPFALRLRPFGGDEARVRPGGSVIASITAGLISRPGALPAERT